MNHIIGGDFLDKLKDFYSDYRDYILFSFSLIVFIIVSVFIFYYFSSSISTLRGQIKDRPVVEEKKEVTDSEKYAVNIKGEVKRPGVYYLDKNKRVIDVVNKAGGFTKDADSYVNNLSKKITDEMVIVIYSKSEMEDYENTKNKEKIKLEKCQNDIVVNNSCAHDNNKNANNTDNSSIKDTNKTDNSDKSKQNDVQIKDTKISINTATKEELMTLSGIGESKAIAIIDYRNNKKFETIEEIKEVSGIGDSLFEKIKDFITT